MESSGVITTSQISVIMQQMGASSVISRGREESLLYLILWGEVKKCPLRLLFSERNQKKCDLMVLRKRLFLGIEVRTVIR